MLSCNMDPTSLTIRRSHVTTPLPSDAGASYSSSTSFASSLFHILQMASRVSIHTADGKVYPLQGDFIQEKNQHEHDASSLSQWIDALQDAIFAANNVPPHLQHLILLDPPLSQQEYNDTYRSSSSSTSVLKWRRVCNFNSLAQWSVSSRYSSFMSSFLLSPSTDSRVSLSNTSDHIHILLLPCLDGGEPVGDCVTHC